MNGGLMAMIVLSLLPVGLLQTVASVKYGYWYSRSSEFLGQGVMQTLRWLRMPGDTLFAIGAGGLSGSGRMDLALAVAAAMAATVGADLLWYSLGRCHGTRVLGILCRFSLDPDSLIRHAKELFAAHRLRYLVLAKFLPGVNPL